MRPDLFRRGAAACLALILLSFLSWKGVAAVETIPSAATTTGATAGANTTTAANGVAAGTDATVKALPEPYDPVEFPLWARDLRRGDIVAFGTLPFTVFFATFAVDSYRYWDKGWDRRYAPWPLKSAGAIDMDDSLKLSSLAAGAVFSVGLALVDHLIVRSKRESKRRRIEAKGPETPIEISRTPPQAED